MNKHFLEVAIRAAKSSGQILLQRASQLHDIKLKSESQRDVVTEVDLESEENIRSLISYQFPEHNIIGEEGAILNKHSDYCWIIDPIDGTVNYIHGIPLYCVTIGLTYQSEIILGVTYSPVLDEMFYASKGDGAYMNGKQIKMERNIKINNALFIAAIPTESKSNHINYESVFHQMNSNSRGVLRIGSTAIAMAYTACGRADGFWTYKYQPWDIAAGIILIKEAGGMISHAGFQESLVSDNEKGICIAANKSIYNQFSKVFAVNSKEKLV